MLATRQIALASGSFSITGSTASLLAARQLACASGSFSLTGNAATLAFSGQGTAYSLACDPGSFTITGQPATLTQFIPTPPVPPTPINPGTGGGGGYGVVLAGVIKENRKEKPLPDKTEKIIEDKTLAVLKRNKETDIAIALWMMREV